MVRRKGKEGSYIPTLLVAWNSLLDFIYGIPRAAQTILGVYLKRTCSRVTISASSALGVHDDNALHKSTHALTHSHFHVVNSHSFQFPSLGCLILIPMVFPLGYSKFHHIPRHAQQNSEV